MKRFETNLVNYSASVVGSLTGAITNPFAGTVAGVGVKAGYSVVRYSSVSFIVLLGVCLSLFFLTYVSPPNDIGDWGYRDFDYENIRPEYDVNDVWAGNTPVWDLDNVHYWADGVYSFVNEGSMIFRAMGFLQERIPANFVAVIDLKFDHLDFSVPSNIINPWYIICHIILATTFALTILPFLFIGLILFLENPFAVVPTSRALFGVLL